MLGSQGPGITDPNGVRITGAVVIAIGLAVCGAGGWVVRRGPRSPRPPRGSPADLERVMQRRARRSVVWTAISGAILLPIGVGALAYSISLDNAVRDFMTATACRPAAPNSDCYERRSISITGVDISQGRSGEDDTVHFLDNGNAHEVSLHPGGRDSSVMRTGATGTATLWQGRYTDLDVAGVGFATDENPVGQQGIWRWLGVFSLGFGLLYAVGPFAFRRIRKRGSKGAPAAGLPPQPVLELAAVTNSYPGLPFVIRPKRFSQRVKPVAWLLALGFLLFSYLTVGQYGAGLQLVIVAVEAVLLAVFAAWQLLMSRNSALFVDELNFGSVDALGRPRTFARSEASRVVGRTVWNQKSRTSPYPVVFVLGPDGRARLRIMPKLYEPSAMSQLASALRVPLEDDPTPVTPSELNRQIPASTSWLVRHSTAAGALLAVVLIAAVGVAVLLSAGPSHR